MKILIISRDYPNIVGGVADHTYYLAKGLKDMDLEVEILTSEDRRVEQGEKGVKVLDSIRDWSFAGLPGMIKEIKRSNPHWIMLQYVPHMYSKRAIPVYIALLAVMIKLHNYKLITIFHEVAMRIKMRRVRYLLAAFLERLIAYVLSAASNRIVVSVERYRRMLWSFRGKISKIPIGSNISPIEISEEEREELRRAIASPNEVIISTFGGDPRRNGLLLKVAEKLKTAPPGYRFFFLGAYPTKISERIRKEACDLGVDDKVVLTGFLESDDAYRYLSSADIFISLEYEDGGISMKSTSVMAAFGAGLPIISNRGDMTEDFFKHKENVFLMNSLNIDEISETIVALVTDNDLRKQLSSGAKSSFDNQLQWKIICGKYIELLNE